MQENKKFKLVSSKKTRYLLPNILTLGGVCLGISSIKFSIDGNYSLAVIFILFAAILDALDGRIARLIKGTSEFGKELDNWVIQNILFKVLFPAEFHGQSAVEAAIELSEEFNKNINKVKKVNIYTHEPAIRIISNKEILKNASDRDHSLEYMVAAALIYGDLTYEMYEESFPGFEKINDLRKKIFVTEETQYTKDYYEFIDTCQVAADRFSNSFTYTLICEEDLNGN